MNTAEVINDLRTAPFTGRYPDPSKVAGWRGWIERDGGIAFVHVDGSGLWWSRRETSGGVIGHPVSFDRDKGAEQ